VMHSEDYFELSQSQISLSWTVYLSYDYTY